MPGTLKALAKPQSDFGLLLLQLKASTQERGGSAFLCGEARICSSRICKQILSWLALRKVPGRPEVRSVVGDFPAAQPSGEPERKPEQCLSRGGLPAVWDPPHHRVAWLRPTMPAAGSKPEVAGSRSQGLGTGILSVLCILLKVGSSSDSSLPPTAFGAQEAM